MAETPQSSNPAGLVFDPRYNNILLGFSYLKFGQQPASGEMTLRVEEGEGEVWFEPGVLPTMGSIQQGTLVVASECFPRFAPLTMTLTGADLCFNVRLKHVVSFGVLNGRGETATIRGA